MATNVRDVASQRNPLNLASEHHPSNLADFLSVVTLFFVSPFRLRFPSIYPRQKRKVHKKNTRARTYWIYSCVQCPDFPNTGLDVLAEVRNILHGDIDDIQGVYFFKLHRFVSKRF